MTRESVWRAGARDLRDALRASREPSLRAAVFGKTPMAVAGGVGWVALNLNAQALPFAGGAAATLGALQALRGAGTGVGPLAANHVIGRGARAHIVAHVAAIATFAGAIGIAMADSAAAALASVFIWGAGGGSLWVITQTEIQQRGLPAMRGRLLSLDALGFTVGMSGGALVTGVVVDSGLDVGPLAIAVGSLAAVAWFWVRGRAVTRATGASPMPAS